MSRYRLLIWIFLVAVTAANAQIDTVINIWTDTSGVSYRDTILVDTTGYKLYGPYNTAKPTTTSFLYMTPAYPNKNTPLWLNSIYNWQGDNWPYQSSPPYYNDKNLYDTALVGSLFNTYKGKIPDSYLSSSYWVGVPKINKLRAERSGGNTTLKPYAYSFFPHYKFPLYRNSDTVGIKLPEWIFQNGISDTSRLSEVTLINDSTLKVRRQEDIHSKGLLVKKTRLDSFLITMTRSVYNNYYTTNIDTNYYNTYNNYYTTNIDTNFYITQIDTNIYITNTTNIDTNIYITNNYATPDTFVTGITAIPTGDSIRIEIYRNRGLPTLYTVFKIGVSGSGMIKHGINDTTYHSDYPLKIDKGGTNFTAYDPLTHFQMLMKYDQTTEQLVPTTLLARDTWVKNGQSFNFHTKNSYWRLWGATTGDNLQFQVGDRAGFIDPQMRIGLEGIYLMPNGSYLGSIIGTDSSIDISNNGYTASYTNKGRISNLMPGILPNDVVVVKQLPIISGVDSTTIVVDKVGFTSDTSIAMWSSLYTFEKGLLKKIKRLPTDTILKGVPVVTDPPKDPSDPTYCSLLSSEKRPMEFLVSPNGTGWGLSSRTMKITNVGKANARYSWYLKDSMVAGKQLIETFPEQSGARHGILAKDNSFNITIKDKYFSPYLAMGDYVFKLVVIDSQRCNYGGNPSLDSVVIDIIVHCQDTVGDYGHLVYYVPNVWRWCDVWNTSNPISYIRNTELDNYLGTTITYVSAKWTPIGYGWIEVTMPNGDIVNLYEVSNYIWTSDISKTTVKRVWDPTSPRFLDPETKDEYEAHLASLPTDLKTATKVSYRDEWTGHTDYFSIDPTYSNEGCNSDEIASVDTDSSEGKMIKHLINDSTWHWGWPLTIEHGGTNSISFSTETSGQTLGFIAYDPTTNKFVRTPYNYANLISASSDTIIALMDSVVFATKYWTDGLFLKKTDTTNKWQPKGIYLTPADSNNIRTGSNALYQPKGSYITASDTANKWQPKGSYASLVHGHVVDDINEDPDNNGLFTWINNGKLAVSNYRPISFLASGDSNVNYWKPWKVQNYVDSKMTTGNYQPILTLYDLGNFAYVTTGGILASSPYNYLSFVNVSDSNNYYWRPWKIQNILKDYAQKWELDDLEKPGLREGLVYIDDGGGDDLQLVLGYGLTFNETEVPGSPLRLDTANISQKYAQITQLSGYQPIQPTYNMSEFVWVGEGGIYYSSGYSPSSFASSAVSPLTLTNGALSVASGYTIPTTTQISNWNTAYGWGNHANAGYLTSSSLNGYATQTWVGQQGYITDGNTNWNNSYGFITSSDLSTYATQVYVHNYAEGNFSPLGHGHDGTYLPLGGGTLSGPLYAGNYLYRAGSLVATETWVSSNYQPAGSYATQTWVGNNYLPLSGGALSGSLTQINGYLYATDYISSSGGFRSAVGYMNQGTAGGSGTISKTFVTGVSVNKTSSTINYVDKYDAEQSATFLTDVSLTVNTASISLSFTGGLYYQNSGWSGTYKEGEINLTMDEYNKLKDNSWQIDPEYLEFVQWKQWKKEQQSKIKLTER